MHKPSIYFSNFILGADTYILSPLVLIHLWEIQRQTLQKVFLKSKQKINFKISL